MGGGDGGGVTVATSPLPPLHPFLFLPLIMLTGLQPRTALMYVPHTHAYTHSHTDVCRQTHTLTSGHVSTHTLTHTHNHRLTRVDGHRPRHTHTHTHTNTHTHTPRHIHTQLSEPPSGEEIERARGGERRAHRGGEGGRQRSDICNGLSDAVVPETNDIKGREPDPGWIPRPVPLYCMSLPPTFNPLSCHTPHLSP